MPVDFRVLAKRVLGIAADVIVGSMTAVTFVKVTVGVYSPALGTTSDVLVNTVISQAFVYGLDEAEASWFPADAVMQKVIVAYADLQLTPETHDYFMIAGKRWEIRRVATPPTQAIRIFYIEEP